MFPIPSINDIFELCGNSAIYTTLDLKAGYHQMGWQRKIYTKLLFVVVLVSMNLLKCRFV